MQRQWLHWKNRVLYAVNKLQYDAQKKAELIWYGSKNVGSAHANVSVPFMVTRQMRVQLAEIGFPSHVVAALTPADAHAILQSNTSYDIYFTQAKARATTSKSTGSSAMESSVSTDASTTNQHSYALTFVPNTEDKDGKECAERCTTAAALVIVPEKAPSSSA
ncbi:hypothetical protein H310_03872 [Aphanomyces invadans]|uniref:Uncharacterized protein n=1 Tax=Aphanomyces invadans TaxID=157072 RepID=A0A024UFQ5_9STRA|nr:hypothetical protein H310_03872 [Aphanomyces invadans]ETW04722.1 hypothetical protein H310_03872 [Aphanomyces invadans]RHY29752.1 hypothetical protein DYB32_004870 [Aphanomyces invadans]|eukprot:XP_008866160.1 hypothetical protein H310_03872 [Aphanomyces invadans]